MKFRVISRSIISFTADSTKRSPMCGEAVSEQDQLFAKEKD
jgi:hypothetical protein